MFTITTFFLLAGLLLVLNDFSLRKLSFESQLSTSFVGARTVYTADDIKEDIEKIMDLEIIKDGYRAIFIDNLPAAVNIQEFLARYGDFLSQYYTTPDLEVIFLSVSGTRINLEDIPPQVTILPFGITYGYPDYGKRELLVASPTENISAIQRISVYVRLTSDFLNESQWQWNPRVACQPDHPCLTVDLTFDDGYITHEVAEKTFNADGLSKLKVSCGVGDCWIEVRIGQTGTSDPQSLVNLRLHKINVTTTTTILLNTTEFSINYLSKIRAISANYEVQKEDWL